MSQHAHNTDDVDQPRPELTGRLLAEAAASDFSDFFLPWCPYHVRLQFGPTPMPKVRKDGSGSYIVIPNDMANDVITTPERLLFHLLMIGHEIAHLVHRHLDGADAQSAEDFRSLELWADFYGAKAAMTLLTYGRKVHPLAAGFWPDRDLHRVLDDLGGAVGALVTKVYSDHRRYPKRLERAGMISNGVMSFVRAYYGERFDPRLYVSVNLRVFLCPQVRELIDRNDGGFESGDEPLYRSAAWHQKAQGASAAITPGFHPKLSQYLHTNFDQTEEEMEAARKVRLDEMKRVGLLDDLVPAESIAADADAEQITSTPES